MQVKCTAVKGQLMENFFSISLASLLMTNYCPKSLRARGSILHHRLMAEDQQYVTIRNYIIKAIFHLLQTMQLVKDFTGNSDDIKARDLFISEIQAADKFFNDNPFPSNESDENAFIKCFDAVSAKLYCPKRWEAMQTWIKDTNEVTTGFSC